MTTVSRVQEISLAMVAVVFLWAAIAKLVSNNDFKVTLQSTPYLPAIFIPVIALLLPPLEISISLGLMPGVDIAKLGAVGLLLAFCLIAAIVLKLKLKVPCNCFGSGERVFSRWTIAQNAALIALVCVGTPAKDKGDIILDLLIAASALVVGTSALTIWNNRKMVIKLRRVNAIK